MSTKKTAASTTSNTLPIGTIVTFERKIRFSDERQFDRFIIGKNQPKSGSPQFYIPIDETNLIIGGQYNIAQKHLKTASIELPKKPDGRSKT